MYTDPIKSPHFILLGASLDTGNLGVSALLASTIKGVLAACPDARFSLFEGRKSFTDTLYLADGRAVQLGCVGVRRNKTVWRQNHILRLLMTALFSRLICVSSWRNKYLLKNPYLRQIMDAQFVGDITGGDSFSDIYGMRRIMISSLFKMLPIILGTNFVLLPQTYGPFKSRLSRYLARWSIQRASAVYSRDQEGLQAIERLIGGRRMKAVPQFCPDVAFLLDVILPENEQVKQLEKLKSEDLSLIGLNINGLLYNGGYTRDNMFGLKSDYKAVVNEIIRQLFQQPNIAILLVPHVFLNDPLAVESDPVVCKKVYEQLRGDYPGRLYCLEGKYDQSEIKFMIGQCDFFIGSRMHACIAALSQGIPAVGLAYSKKFLGVFESASVAECVVDARTETLDDILEKVTSVFVQRKRLAEQLHSIIPQIQEVLCAAFESICSISRKA